MSRSRARLRARRLSLVLSTVGALLAAMLAVTPASVAAQAVDEVHYTFTSRTSVAIDWRGDARDVRWGPTTSYGNTAQGVAPQWTPWSSPGPFWQLELEGLSAGATYHYSIGGGPDYVFHTPPTGSFRFDAIGDVGDTSSFSKLSATLSGIASDDPSFVLMVGDLTYANAVGASIGVIDQHFNDVMSSWGTSAAYIPAWGNHEYDVPGSDDLRNYKGRLLMPNAEASPGSPSVSCCGNDWGWFDAGPARFIAYPEPWTGAWADWQAKANSLMNQAQNDPAIKYVITYGHRPAYSTGYHPGEAQLATILDGFGSSYGKYVLNINGHSHDYERFQPIQGVTHVTVGAPSSVEVPWTSTDARTAYRAMHLSHLRVDVSDTGLRLQAVCDGSVSKEDVTCSQGSVIDEYVIGTPPATPPKTEYYVDKTVAGCSDSGPGTAATPFCTVTKGVSRLQPGYTLYVGDGTYAEAVKPLVSGTAGNPITITAWPGRSPTVGTGVTNGVYVSTRSYVTVSNLTVAGTIADGFYLTKSDHITIVGNKVSGAGKPQQGATAPGISVRATNASTITGNTSDRNNGHGIYVTNTSTGNTIADNEASFNAEGWQRNANGIDVTSPGNTVLRNVTHDNEDSGIQFYTGADNSLAALNVTYNNGDHGIDNLNVVGGRVISNTVYRNCTSGINVEGTSTNYTVVDNIAVDNAVYPAYNGIACSRRAGNIGIWDSAPPSTVVDHNLVQLTKSGILYVFKTSYTSLAAMQAATGQEVHGVQGDPKFLDKATGNLQLVEGSPAIDRGDSAVSGAQDHDILGEPRVRDPLADNSHATGPRGYDDLGAYEYQPDVAPAPTGPTAVLGVTPTAATAPAQVTADASGSSDPQGQALGYTFDWGDGTTSPRQSTPTATHTYSSAGSYSVKVTVTDSSGLTDTATQVVTVTAAPAAPTARLTVSPTLGTAPVQVTADGSTSTDPQGQSLTYAFDFGDGTTVAAQAAKTAAHTYTEAGTYVVSMTVRNTSGLTDTTTKLVSVKAPDSAPHASLSVSPTSGTAPLQVAADGSPSTDPQGYPLTYAFDFGDGTTTPAQPSPSAAHTYSGVGTYTVTMTVTASSGLTDTARGTVTVSAPASPPTARLDVSPSSGTAPVQVSADGTASTDPQGQALTYAFEFGDGSATGPQSSATASHTYTSAGAYTVTMTVTNASGLVDTAAATVTVDAPATAPTARLVVSPSSGTAPLQVSADASGSSDPQGRPLSYAFDFGDGSTAGPQSAATAPHTYVTPGTYTVWLTVTTASGLSDTTTASVTVNAPSAPTARLDVTPASGAAPVQVSADGSATTDPQGQALSYVFDFGDGSSAGPQAGATAGHTYPVPGSYQVTMTVTNTSGLSDSVTRTVTVDAPPVAPTARLDVSPTSGTAPVQVSADASASTDPQGQALSYVFDFGDGSTAGPQAGATASHTFTTAGTYTVKVTVTNTSGLSDSVTRTVTIDAAPVAPTARLGVSPSSGTAPVQVTADASASTDSQGQVLSYVFDFGDGSTAGPQSSATASHTFTAAGSFTVKVTVTNTSGLSDSATRTVTVAAAPVAPTARLDVSPTSGTAPVQVSADASASTDPQGQALSYVFDFGDGSTAGPQSSATASHTFTAAGSFTVKVTVTNTSGLSDSVTRTVTVAAAPVAPTARLGVSPSSGTAPVQVTADASASTDPQGQALSYVFDFGDGSTAGPQATATATHTYTAAGTFTVKVTVTNTSGLASTATQSVTVKPAPGYVGQLGTASSATAVKSASVTVGSAVKAGDMVVVSAQVTTGASKPLTATDDAGNTYVVASSQGDSTGAKLTILYGLATKPLPAGARITVTFSSTTAYRLVADQLTGVSTADTSAIATGKTAAFSSGASKKTTVAREVSLGVVGLTGASGPPTWAAGWTPSGTFSAGTSSVGRAYRVLSSMTTVTASGSASGTWTAAVVNFRP